MILVSNHEERNHTPVSRSNYSPRPTTSSLLLQALKPCKCLHRRVARSRYWHVGCFSPVAQPETLLHVCRQRPSYNNDISYSTRCQQRLAAAHQSENWKRRCNFRARLHVTWLGSRMESAAPQTSVVANGLLPLNHSPRCFLAGALFFASSFRIMLKVYCLHQDVTTRTSEAIVGGNLTLAKTTLTHAVYSERCFLPYRSGMSQIT